MNQRQEPPELEQLDEFDQHFDQALSSYAPPEPRPGLEQRILAHMQAHAASHPDLPARRRLRWLPRLLWIGSGLTVATLLVALMIPCNCVSRYDADRLARRHPAPPLTQAGPLHAHLAASARPLHRPALHPVATVAAELTPQERLLTQFVAHHPDAALGLAKSAPSLSEPIAVKPLDPEPIRLEALSVEPIHIELIDLTVQQPPSY